MSRLTSISCLMFQMFSILYLINLTREKGFKKVGSLEDCNINCYKNGCLSDSKVTYYNRSTRVVNFNMTYLRALDDNAVLSNEFYKWINNQYVLFLPMNFKFSLKHFMSSDYFGFGSLLRTHTKPPMTWPVDVNKVYVGTNWIVPSEKFPPNIPTGRYKVAMRLYPNGIKGNSAGIIEILFKYTEVYDYN